MFSNEIRRTATAAVAALVLTTTFVGAAVAPARAVETDRTIKLAAAAPAAETRASDEAGPPSSTTEFI